MDVGVNVCWLLCGDCLLFVPKGMGVSTLSHACYTVYGHRTHLLLLAIAGDTMFLFVLGSKR